ncbi:hypothetical protein K7X08_025373 [Anisodus acutangulus]|uniref:Uncharacterized protein n=1 Tax=Anisodus acutangulus TaxID=402998 RepID=A0A9Q1R8Z4_9SOLA|nr:hypothetical protein K7X08_025373 [Anisodus acutangulus]
MDNSVAMGQEWHQYVGSAICRKESVNREFVVCVFLEMTSSGNDVLPISSNAAMQDFCSIDTSGGPGR